MAMLKKLAGVGLLGVLSAGCSANAQDGAPEGTAIDARDVKPEDGSELEGANLGSTAQPHALHYTDGTNQWLETAYPMGADNPNCKDWWMYDRYLSSRPALGWSSFSTYQTEHAWAKGAYIDQMQGAIPTDLGYSSVWKSILIDHNAVVARSSGKCSGRYVFQWDNRTNYGPFEKTSYWVQANIPSYLIPPNKAACTATAGESVPAVMIDLYVCEAPNHAAVGGSISAWCSKNGGHWRKYGSASTTGWWQDVSKTCSVATGVYYPAQADRVAVSFNMVIKAGVGHGVAPAEIYVYRYN